MEDAQDARQKAKEVYGVADGEKPLGTPGIELNGHPVEDGDEYFGVKKQEEEKVAVKSGIRGKRR